jgi:hypothetical protein
MEKPTATEYHRVVRRGRWTGTNEDQSLHSHPRLRHSRCILTHTLPTPWMPPRRIGHAQDWLHAGIGVL